MIGAMDTRIRNIATVLRSLRIIQLRNTAIAIRIGRLKGRTELPAAPERIQMFETLVQRGRIDRKFRERDCGCQCDVRERWRFTAEYPFPSVRQMLIDQGCMCQCLL